MSLNWDELETPIQAFYHKGRQKKEAITIYYMQVTYGDHMVNRNMRRGVNNFRKLHIRISM